MISFTFYELLSIASVVVMFALILFLAMTIYSHRRHTKYDEESKRVELELMRKSIESKLYGLNEKLLATESRWRDVNHLLISSQALQSESTGSGKNNISSDFLNSAGISSSDLVIEPDLIFVLTPFHPKHKKQFEVIASVCAGVGLRAMRGDEKYVTGDVFPHILRLIAKARIVIANIDGRNPNVFYELGIAHALGKPTVLIAPTPEDVPFDLRTKRLVLFKSIDELREKLKDELARVVIAGERQSSPEVSPREIIPYLNNQARFLLKEAVRVPDPDILVYQFIGGLEIQVNGKIVASSKELIDIDAWHDAIVQLKNWELVVVRSTTSPVSQLGLTTVGYRVAETLRD